MERDLLLSAVLRRALVTATALSLLSSSSHAQSVRGVVVDPTDRPVAGVVVLLVDSASATAARALSNARGEYRLAAPHAGTYRLRALRIGYRPVTSERFLLGVGRDVTSRLALSGLAVFLDTVRVTDRAACRVVSDSAAATFAVWEQVRTALTAAQLTDSTLLAATTVGYERTLDPSARRVWKQSYSVRSDLVTQPWASMPPDSLHRRGYLQTAGDVTTYFAPGIDALLSNEFIEDHCVRLTASSDGSRVGLAFEPTSARKEIPEIRGTLWLDRASSELRSLEFGYVNIPRAQQDRAGGEMDFVRMRDGQWAISRWNIRMPRLLLGLSSGNEVRVAEIAVAGGDLSLVRRGADTIWSRPPLALAGLVTDSSSGIAVQDATVMLRGTELEAVTDRMGRFRIAGVLPGEYTLDVTTPSLDSLSAVSQSTLLFTDSTRVVQLRVPSPQQIATAICGAGKFDSPGILVGNVDMLADTLPRSVKVLAEWYEAGVRSEGASGRRSRWLEARTDKRGRFRLCGVPLNTSFVLSASSDSAIAPPIEVRIPAGGRFGRADLMLQRAFGNAVFAGSVVADSTNVPLAGRGTKLGAVVVVESAIIPRFEEHRKAGLGVFLTRDDLVRQPGRRMADALGQVRGLIISRGSGNNGWALGKRAPASIPKNIGASDCGTSLANPCTFSTSDPVTGVYCPGPDERNLNMECGCYVQIYRDNILLNRGRPTPPYDVNEISTDDIEAVEYYGSAAEAPMQYAALNSPCGVLVLHTRRPRS